MFQTKLLCKQNLLRIRFDGMDGFIKIYNEIIYLAIFGTERYDAIYNRIRYLIGKNVL